MMIEKTKLDGVLLIKLDGFEDHRGEYLELLPGASNSLHFYSPPTRCTRSRHGERRVFCL